MGKMILASASPRRAEILKDYRLEIIPSPYKEKHTKTAFSYSYVENLAYNKAMAVADMINDDAVVIGADTVVVLGDEILEKPKDRDDAYLMLKKLSNNTHIVVTAIALVDSKTGKSKIQSTTSRVTFSDLSDELINYYIDNFKPFDKAGSYGIQELPEGFVKSIDGDLENIIGISSKTFADMLKEF